MADLEGKEEPEPISPSGGIKLVDVFIERRTSCKHGAWKDYRNGQLVGEPVLDESL